MYECSSGNYVSRALLFWCLEMNVIHIVYEFPECFSCAMILGATGRRCPRELIVCLFISDIHMYICVHSATDMPECNLNSTHSQYHTYVSSLSVTHM
jgi:hypothetical protein